MGQLKWTNRSLSSLLLFCIEKAIKAISARMLEGWTLLGDACDKCVLPLVRKNQKTECVKCDSFVVPASDNVNNSDVIMVDSPYKKRKMSEELENASRDVVQFAEMDDGWKPPTEQELAAIDAKMARADKVSAKLGQLMLQGWALLDLNCDKCLTPFVRNRQKQLLCVECDEYYYLDDQGQLVECKTKADKSKPSSKLCSSNSDINMATNSTSSGSIRRITIRRLNKKRGGKMMSCPTSFTLQDIKSEGGKLLGIGTAAKVRTFATEAEVSDISIIRDEDILILTTQEEEMEF